VALHNYVNKIIRDTVPQKNTSNNWREKKEHMALEIQLLAWDRNTNEAGLTQIMGSQPPSNNWTPMTIQI
jgi:hypothetical protein